MNAIPVVAIPTKDEIVGRPDHAPYQPAIRDICDLAGANPGAVSYHFGGKRQLYRTVLRQAAEGLAAAASNAELFNSLNRHWQRCARAKSRGPAPGASTGPNCEWRRNL